MYLSCLLFLLVHKIIYNLYFHCWIHFEVLELYSSEFEGTLITIFFDMANSTDAALLVEILDGLQDPRSLRLNSCSFCISQMC